MEILVYSTISQIYNEILSWMIEIWMKITYWVTIITKL